MSTVVRSSEVIPSRVSLITRVATCFLAVVGAVGTAATAHADTNDNKFLTELKSEGITDHVSSAHAIEAGHVVCQKLDGGMTPTEVAYDVLNSSTMPAYHSGYFVGASINAYCPQYTSKISTGS
jgi:hypothetical protein